MGPVRRTVTSFGDLPIDDRVKAYEAYDQASRNDSLPLSLRVHSIVWNHLIKTGQLDDPQESQKPQVMGIPFEADDTQPIQTTWHEVFQASLAKKTESSQAEQSNPKSRDSSHKVMLSLFPVAARVAGARVLQIGGTKPGRWHYNWRDQPVKFTQYLDAVYRHLAAYEAGEDDDSEMSALDGSPVNHIDAALSSLAILIDARENGVLIDDRYKSGSDGAAGFMRRVTKSSP